MRYIRLDHGAGGLLSKELLDKVIIPILQPVYTGIMEDSGTAILSGNHIAFTTDSFVIDPVVFGNGDIGKIAVCGTINDLSTSGAKPMYLSLSLILEEGLSISVLEKILHSVCLTCQESNVKILAGDTKVVRKGEADKIYINTAGVGVFIDHQIPLHISNIKTNDDIIISGLVGNHGIHILSMREGLGFESKVLSDCAPLNLVIDNILFEYGSYIHYMRDMTRGGMGSILNEIAVDSGFGISLKKELIPLQHETIMASEMLGVNPFYLANEGNICIFCDPYISESLQQKLRTFKYTQYASNCGKVINDNSTNVRLIEQNGGIQIIDFLEGQQLPRLC